MDIIIGMAKSNLDLKGAKSQKLELDFLRLGYFVKNAKNGDEECIKKGYLMVTKENIKTSVEGWRQKYSITEEEVEIIVADLTKEEIDKLENEKKRNRKGMIEGTTSQGKNKDSIADLGKKLEKKLKREIEKRENTKELPSKFRQINWDYCGSK